MIQRPKHLSPEHAAVFKDQCVAEAYSNRAPYPPGVFSLLLESVVDKPRVALELGCGTGEIARGLAPHVEHVDAVDPSEAMLKVAKALPGGDHPQLAWTLSTAEEFGYPATYALILTPESLGWMDWEVVFPLMERSLSPNGRVVVLVRDHTAAWDAGTLDGIVPRYSTSRDYKPFDLVEELGKGGLFHVERRVTTEPSTITQPVEDYVEFWHSRSGFSRERMGTEQAGAFDDEVRRLVEPHSADGVVRYGVSVDVVWGRPRAP